MINNFKEEQYQNNSGSLNKFALLFEFDGKNFSGSQIQQGYRTVQQVLEEALKIALREDIKTTFSGRTDTGVSALGQVAHFETTQVLDEYRIVYSLNGILPEDIAIRAMQHVSNDFDARRSGTKRWYRYVIYNHPYKTALNQRCLHVYQKLNIHSMNQALSKILGTHNFESFKSANSTYPYSDCTLMKACCTEAKDYIYIDIVANRFIYNMVRILVGTLLEIGKGEKAINHLYNVLAAQDRTQAGITVKPEGLTLMAIEYPEVFNLFNDDKNDKVKDFLMKNTMEINYEDLLCKTL